MKLRLQNFLCYTDTTFDFGSTGLTLISGPSGCGKTSILRAVFFALFGDGIKVQSYGKTSCSVELTIDDLKIVRTKRPNRLVVNDIYEDDAAQSIITTKFGTTFKSSGYIQQNNLTSFILMSPSDKLTFLEQFAFQDTDLGKIKGKCKSHISRCNEELLGTTAKLEISIQQFDEIIEPEKVSFPLKCKIENREMVIKNENIRLKNTTKLINTAEKEIIQMNAEIHAYEILNTTIKGKQDNIDSIDKKISKLVDEEETISYIGDDCLDNMKIQLNKLLANKNIINLENSYSEHTSKLLEIKNSELSEYQKEYDDIEVKLWSDYTIEELESTLKDNISFLKDINTVNNLNSELSDYNITENFLENIKLDLEKYQTDLDTNEKLLCKIHNQREIYTCPSCNSGLHMIDCQLKLTDNCTEEYIDTDTNILEDEIQNSKTIISRLKKQLQKGENQLITKNKIESKINTIIDQYEELPELETIQDDITYLQKYKINQQHQEKRMVILKDSIEHEKLSTTYNNYKKSTDDIYEKLCIMRNKSGVVDTKYDEKQTRNIITTNEIYYNRLKDISTLKTELNDDKISLVQDINDAKSIHKSKYENSDIITHKDIQEKKDTIVTLLEKKENHENNLIQIDLWTKYQQDKKNYSDWKDKIKTLKNKEKMDRNRYTAANMLKNKILEAESISISNIIDSINIHARGYLDCFFNDHPISVQLQSFKETKKSTKPCINTTIEYKGMECDLTMLSGGELSRVVLAYTLALSEMFNTPLLLLDECTSSLDQDLTNIVFDGIRDSFKNKLIIIIAHQVIVGTFDKIITL
jgi:DNA repair exonuclease SbcCD ATPase subunit